MRRSGLLHGELSKVIAELGHGQCIVLADCGLPIPDGPQLVDLAVSRGVPSLSSVLEAILSELPVESFTVAAEFTVQQPAVWTALQQRIGTDYQVVPHGELKRLTSVARAFIRTGECTPYANVILYAGVAF